MVLGAAATYRRGMAFNESITETTRLLGELEQQLDHWRSVSAGAGGLTWEQQIAEQQAIGTHLVHIATSTVESIVEAYRDLMKTQEVLVDVRSRVEALERR